MNNIYTYLLLFLLVISASSCNRDDAPVIISEIVGSENLVLELREGLEESGLNTTLVKISTNSAYNCDNGKLRSNLVKTNDNEILINIIGLDFPPQDECEGEEIASSIINLGDLIIDQTFELKISLLGEIKSSGTVVNHEDKIVVSMPSNTSNGITVHENLIKKVPAGGAWGYIEPKDGTNQMLVDSFINEMEIFGSPIESLGAFGHFRIEQDGSATIYEFDRANETQSLEGFAIRNSTDFNALVSKAENLFCNDDNIVKIWNSEGLVFSCD